VAWGGEAEVPNFALYIMGAMARRIRGMSQAM